MNINKLKRWLTTAENNLKTASILIKSAELVSDNICFHCQQAVKKYLKAFLVFHQKDFRKINIIAKLLKSCIEIDDSFFVLKDLNIQSLSIYAREIRYPDDFYIPTIEEAKEAISLAEKTKEFILNKLKEKGFSV